LYSSGACCESLGIHNEGMSQRKIADIVGCGQKTVSRLLGTEVESNKPMVKMTQEETLEVEGGENERSVKIPQEENLEVEGDAKRPTAKMHQEENLEVEGEENERSVKIPQEEDTSSVFTHCTSVEPVANPWVCLTI
jgi:transposase